MVTTTATEPDDVLAAILCDPLLTVEECRREAAALSGVRLPVDTWTNPDTEPADE